MKIYVTCPHCNHASSNEVYQKETIYVCGNPECKKFFNVVVDPVVKSITPYEKKEVSSYSRW